MSIFFSRGKNPRNFCNMDQTYIYIICTLPRTILEKDYALNLYEPMEDKEWEKSIG